MLNLTRLEKFRTAQEQKLFKEKLLLAGKLVEILRKMQTPVLRENIV